LEIYEIYIKRNIHRGVSSKGKTITSPSAITAVLFFSSANCDARG